jgi:threonine dehydratase
VSEAQIADAMRWLSQAHDARVEGSGAVSVAALLSRGGWEGPVAAVVSGGNVDAAVWTSVVSDAVAAD